MTGQPADIVLFAPDPGEGGGRRGALTLDLSDALLDRGARAARITLLGENERRPWPGGYYAEGWLDPRAERIAFGARDGAGNLCPPTAPEIFGSASPAQIAAGPERLL